MKPLENPPVSSPPTSATSPSEENRGSRHARARQRKGLGRYRKGKKLGQGAFGSVYLGIDQLSGEMVAIKELQVDSLSSDTEVRNEFDLLRTLQHPNIVRYIDYEFVEGSTNSTLRIYLEYVDGGSMASVLKQYGGLCERVCSKYVHQTILGLKYLHESGVIHRDIKPANLLVNSSGEVKLADFGASKKLSDGATTLTETKFIGTPAYIAPEAIRGKHTFAADIWSVGCTLLELVTGRNVWVGTITYDGVADFIKQISENTVMPTIPEELSDECRDFISRCMQRDPKTRASCEELLQHPFLVINSDNETETESEVYEEEEDFGSDEDENKPIMSTMDVLFQTTDLDSTNIDYVGLGEPVLENKPLAQTSGNPNGRSMAKLKAPGNVTKSPQTTVTPSKGNKGAKQPRDGWFTPMQTPIQTVDEPLEEAQTLAGLFIAAHHCNDMVAKGFFPCIESKRSRKEESFDLETPLESASLRLETPLQSASLRLESPFRRASPSLYNSRLESGVSGMFSDDQQQHNYIKVEGTPDGLVKIHLDELGFSCSSSPTTSKVFTFKFDVFFNEKTTPFFLFKNIGVPIIRSLMKSKTANKRVSITCAGMPYSGKSQTVIGTDNVFIKSQMGFLPYLIKQLYEEYSKTHLFYVSSMTCRKGKEGIFDNIHHRLIQGVADWDILRLSVLELSETWENALDILDLSKLAFLGVKSPHMLAIEVRSRSQPEQVVATLHVTLFYGRQWTYWLNGLTLLCHHYFAYSNPSCSLSQNDSEAVLGPPQIEEDLRRYTTNEFFGIVEQIYRDQTSMNYILHNFHSLAGHVDEIVSSLSALESATTQAPKFALDENDDEE
eukprot:TRINITY_DN5322_c0_g1_i1.p1 TRINITY_DN5322_c0_g1~~TRINITY_DN5322_c0_g1_i1.p1  ORF type:complete len:840 (+),score=125.22 TRINITY_DN5322_c0_g1_i1:45-2564(+)